MDQRPLLFDNIQYIHSLLWFHLPHLFVFGANIIHILKTNLSCTKPLGPNGKKPLWNVLTTKTIIYNIQVLFVFLSKTRGSLGSIFIIILRYRSPSSENADLSSIGFLAESMRTVIMLLISKSSLSIYNFSVFKQGHSS